MIWSGVLFAGLALIAIAVRVSLDHRSADAVVAGDRGQPTQRCQRQIVLASALPHLEEPSYRRSCRPVPGETSKTVCADRLSCCARRLDCPENDQLLTVFSGCQ